MRIPKHYKDRRLEGTTPVRHAQLIELHLLEVFKKICDDHGLRWWLDGGTLLGAMRHDGFIPWDDDLDVIIAGDDYKKFLKYAKDELPEDVYLETPDNNLRMENHITRLRDDYSWGLVRHTKRLLINDHHGICIDIFPIRECRRKNRLAVFLLRRWASYGGWFKRAHYNQVTVLNLFVKWWMGFVAFALKLFFELTQVGVGQKRYFVVDTWFLNDRKWLLKDWLVRKDTKPRMHLFEGEMMPIPFEAEKSLEMEYGDWQQMPPEDARKGYLAVALPTTPCFHPKAKKWDL